MQESLGIAQHSTLTGTEPAKALSADECDGVGGSPELSGGSHNN
jgi:hypothetical protein